MRPVAKFLGLQSYHWIGWS